MYTQAAKLPPRAAKGQVVFLVVTHDPACGRFNDFERCTCTPKVVQSVDDTQVPGLSNNSSYEVNDGDSSSG